jgi:hypothetical protein
MRIFTKRFFDLSPIDQFQIVEAALAECDEIIERGFSDDSISRSRAKRKRIEQKAIRYGILGDDTSEV